MFISKKLYNELGDKIADLEKKNTELQALLNSAEAKVSELRLKEGALEVKVREYRTLRDDTPIDCKRGTWCKGCEFGKQVLYRDGRFDMAVDYFCGRGEACPNFVQKQED